jgi:hypothetical protein
MIQTKQIIENNKDKFSDFEDYYRVIGVIEEKLEHSPDMTIESCKALVEGISKTIVSTLNPELTFRKDVNDLFKQALDCMAQHTFIEIDFIRKSGSLVLAIGTIRNNRSDISHGRAVPKTDKSDIKLSKMIMSITDEMLYYILNIYFSIDLGFEEVEEIDIIEEDEEIYPYDKEEHEAYNQMLDEQSGLNDISYSKALYEQDFDAYNYGLEEFLGMEE